MTDSDPRSAQPDWTLATFDGARREQLRRWSRLSLQQIIEALEEMEELSRVSGAADRDERSAPTA